MKISVTVNMIVIKDRDNVIAINVRRPKASNRNPTMGLIARLNVMPIHSSTIFIITFIIGDLLLVIHLKASLSTIILANAYPGITKTKITPKTGRTGCISNITVITVKQVITSNT